MTPKEAQFVSRMEKFGTSTGLSPSVSKVLGYLSVCEPAHQPAAHIQQSLGLSSGAISEALGMLVRSETVVRFKKPGDKKFYYELDADAWKRATIHKLNAISHAVTMAENGMKTFPNNERLKAMHEIYTLFDDELSKIVKKLES